MRMKTAGLWIGKVALVLALGAAVAGLGSAAWASYADKKMEDPGLGIYYKHSRQGSYTSPFDYAPRNENEALPAQPLAAPAGRCNQFTLDATRSYGAEDHNNMTYLWDFGDGKTSNQPVVVHTYDKAGEYRVTLTIRDSSGSLCGEGVAVTMLRPNFAPVPVVGDQKGCLGETLTFDASGSKASGPAVYRWDFGDGTTAEGVKVNHVYQKEGQYRVVLTVDDEKKTECSAASASVTAYISPVAAVTLRAPETSCAGRSIMLDADASGGAPKCHWDFGDGTTSGGGSRVTHVYPKGGTYPVTVKVDNGQGFSCSVASDSKRIKINESPIANAGANLVCCVGTETPFDGSKSTSPTGAKLTYSWDFGDGATAEGVKVTHAYSRSGSYRVVLTVKDDSGSECGMATDSFVAKIRNKLEAVIQVR